MKNTKTSRRRAVESVPYSGQAFSLAPGWGIPLGLFEKYLRPKDYHLIIVRVGVPECFPTSEFRKYAGVDKVEFADWREAVMAVAAHEGMHIQHAYDGGYRTKSGRRRPATIDGVVIARGAKVRVGVERIEPKCEAFEAYMLRRYRAEISVRVEGLEPPASSSQSWRSSV